MVLEVAQLHSLIDLLKKNLYFAEGLSVKELASIVHKKMLQDHSTDDVRKYILSCLSGTRCFYSPDKYLWYMNKRGLLENDEFYNKLFKEKKPLKYSENNKNGKTKRKNKKVIKLNLNLSSDERFVQHDGGKWGLTEWEIDNTQFRMRYHVIKVLAENPEGLKVEKIVEKLRKYKTGDYHPVKDLLNKYPYFFEENNIWSYNSKLRSIYEQMIEKHIASLRRQKLNFFQQKSKMHKKIKSKEVIIKEIQIAREQVASALQEKSMLVEDYDHVVQRFAEKDLLLVLRKKELIKCRKEKQKLENKANCILKECRKWVNESRNLEQENEYIMQEAKHYKEDRDRLTKIEDKLKTELAAAKDKFASDKADLIRENINLKHRLDKQLSRSREEEKKLRTEITRMGLDLKNVLQENQEQNYSLKNSEEENDKLRKEVRRLKSNLKNPLVKLSLKIAGVFAR